MDGPNGLVVGNCVEALENGGWKQEPALQLDGNDGVPTDRFVCRDVIVSIVGWRNYFDLKNDPGSLWYPGPQVEGCFWKASFSENPVGCPENPHKGLVPEKENMVQFDDSHRFSAAEGFWYWIKLSSGRLP